jgi:uncharacterized protein YbgA (DUF1722 family)
MRKWAAGKVRELEKEELDGFIFKSGSPSSGMERVKVFNAKGMPEKKGVGIFARAFMLRFPRLPVIDEGRMHDPALRENFVEAVFTMRRWRELNRGRRSVGELVKFHTAHKMLFLSHSRKHYTEMGRLAADGKKLPVAELFDRYEAIMADALKLKSTRKKNADVLQHAMGYFKKQLSGDEKAEMLEVIDAYRTGSLPLVVPVTLIRHYVRKFSQEYLEGQVYLDPHPAELMLRNHP